MQLELFKSVPVPRSRKAQSRKERLPATRNSPTSQPTARPDPTPEEAKQLATLVSQLEESKFARLFRHLVDSPDPMGKGGCDIGEPAVPLDLPEAELQFKIAGSQGSLGAYTAAWLFHLAHAPAFLWQDELAESFLHERLKKAFANLKQSFPSLQNTTPCYLGPHTRFHSASEGCDDYYLFTNICNQMSEERLERFSDTAHRLFSDILGVPQDRHPRFGIGTPETVVGHASSEVNNFIVELLNMPSSYYFVAREGEISVVPTTEHGAFLASDSTSKVDIPTTGLSTVVTSTLLPERSPTPPGLSDFKSLIDSKKTKEQDLQCFFETNPHFFFGLDERYCEIRSHVCLFDARGDRLIPDFMARVEDSNIWDVIELKRPQHVLRVCNQGAYKPSAAAAHAIRELLQYRDFFSTRKNRERITQRFGTAPYEPCLVLVIGRGRSTARYEWRAALAGFPRVQIVSYDYLFQRARDCNTFLSTKHSPVIKPPTK